MSQQEAVVVVLSSVLVVCAVHRRFKRGRDLDRTLLRWTKRDRFTMRDLLNGGLLTLGITGSGKSSSSSKQLARALVRDRNTFGCILCPKPEDLGFWQEVFWRAGQSHRLLVFDAGSSKLRMNILEQTSRNGDTRDVTRVIMVGRDALRNGEHSRGTENAAFFELQEEMLVHHAVVILKAATDAVSAHALQRFIHTAARLPSDLAEAPWRQEFHNQCVQAAAIKRKSPQEAHDVEQALDYWLRVFPAMEERTRSNIETGVLGTLFVFCNGTVHERLGTTTNFTFDDLQRKRQWLLVNMPPSSYGDSGTLVGSLLKYQMQRAILRRKARPADPVHVVWTDEAQQWCNNRFDAEYLAQCRSHKGCMVFITQSIESFPASMRGDGGKRQTMALLSNFSTKIVHALGSVETAHWLSESLGHRLETHIGGSSQPAVTVFEGLLGQGGSSSNFDQKYEPVLQPGVFLTGLTRTGGPKNRYRSDAIVMRTGKPFSNGENWLHVAFSQR